MKNFQDIIPIWIRTYREIFKSALVKTIIHLKKHVTKLCSLTFPLYNHLLLRIPFFHSKDKKNLIEFSEPKIYYQLPCF